MKKITTRLLCASSILLFGLSSCVKDVDLSQAPEKPVKGDYFDFQTTLNCPIDIDLGLQDYTVSIEIYEMPNAEEAKNVIKELNGAEYAGRPMVVKEALPRN